MVHHIGRPDIFKGTATKNTVEQLLGIFENDDTPVFVCVDEEDKVQGYSFCVFKRHLNDNILTDIKTLYIDDLCVDENICGNHIGKILYEYVIEFAKKVRTVERLKKEVMTMYRILIIEDDNDINNLIKDTFAKNGYICTQAFSGTEGLLYTKTADFDLVILDLMLPGMNGEDVAKSIKGEKSVPIIIVSAKDSIDTKVDLLTSGADDYLTKPFEIRELLARAALQLRKNRGDADSENTLSFGDITLDRKSYSVRVGSESVGLTKQEFKILELLMLHPSKVYSKQEIYSYAWDDIYIGEDKTVNVHISNIRKKIKSIGGVDTIETVWGIGFRLRK